jgi:AAA15 family ATPase/GTPase
MKIDIKPLKESSITKEIKDLELGDYTIFAGENNSGKSNLLKAILSNEDVKTKYKENIIYIPAEDINPQTAVFKTTAAGTNFSQFLRSILKPIVSKWNIDDLIKRFDKSKEETGLFKKVNEYLKKVGITNKEIDIEIDPEQFKEDLIIKNVITPIVIDSHQKKNIEVSLNSIGSGTKRLIIAALLQFYRDLLDTKDEILIIFEEPEAYLHPRLKKGLHENLLELSGNKNIKVIITTHDPYFIQLGNEKKVRIYEVYREGKPDNATQIRLIGKKYLNYDSYAEINYQIFKLPSEAYFLEIYDESKRKAEPGVKGYKNFDDLMFKTYFQAKGLAQSSLDDRGESVTPITRLRHNVAHGKNTNPPPINLKEATENIINFIESQK